MLTQNLLGRFQASDAARIYGKAHDPQRDDHELPLHDITLKQMAAHFGYQPKYLSRLIKQLFNQTFTQSVGKSLLELTTKSIEEISEIVGYPSVSTYYRAFRHETGQTPNEYRKRRQANSAARFVLVALLLLQIQLGAQSRTLSQPTSPLSPLA